MAVDECQSRPNDDETKFIDRILVGWAKWAADDGVHLEPVPTGYIWRIPDVLSIGHELVISDDGFLFVDQRIALLPQRLRDIIHLEYRSPWSAESKWHRAALNRAAYRARLQGAQWSLYALLRPELDKWRQKTVKTDQI